MEQPRVELSISVIRDLIGFDHLQSAWNELVAHEGPLAVFRTFAWQRAWWRHHGGERQLRIVVVRDEKTVIAIFPLYLEREALPFGQAAKVLRFVGFGADTAPDYLDAIQSAEYSEAAARCFLEAVHAMKDWDALCLNDLSRESSLLASIQECTQTATWRSVVRPSAQIAFAELPSTYEEFLQSLSRDLRYVIRSGRKQFQLLPNARFVISSRDRLERDIGALARLHRSRFAPNTVGIAFASPEFNEFHREVMQEYLQRGWLRLCLLEVDGEPIAAHYYYSFKGTWFHFQSGIDLRFAKLSPGTLLTSFAIEAAIQEGARELDMLRGEYQHKDRWATGHRQTFDTLAWRHTLPGFAWSLRWHRMPSIKTRLKTFGWERLDGSRQPPPELPASTA